MIKIIRFFYDFCLSKTLDNSKVLFRSFKRFLSVLKIKIKKVSN